MNYQNEFPDYPVADMPLIPAGFEDSSWHNNSAPSFENRALGLSIWIDFLDPTMRDIEGGERFLVHDIDSEGAFTNDDAILSTDSWDDVLALVAERQSKCQHRNDGRGRCADCGAFI
jgi:hypothetical protein